MSQEPDLTTLPELAVVLDELRRREPIFHPPGSGISRADDARMAADDFWEIGASAQRNPRDYVLDGLDTRRADPVRGRSLGFPDKARSAQPTELESRVPPSDRRDGG